MKIFKKIQYFPSNCAFCKEMGYCLGFLDKNKSEIAICEQCLKQMMLAVEPALNKEVCEKETPTAPPAESSQPSSTESAQGASGSTL